MAGTKHAPRNAGRCDDFGLSTTLFLAMFIAPLTLPSGTVPELHGRANAFDYATVDGALSYGNQPRYDAQTDTMVNPEVPFAWTNFPRHTPSPTPLGT